MDKKKLTIMGYVASGLSLIGLVFNALNMIICWPIWSFANLIWIYWSIQKKENAQLILWISYTIVNIYGWYKWAN